MVFRIVLDPFSCLTTSKPGSGVLDGLHGLFDVKRSLSKLWRRSGNLARDNLQTRDMPNSD